MDAFNCFIWKVIFQDFWNGIRETVSNKLVDHFELEQFFFFQNKKYPSQLLSNPLYDSKVEIFTCLWLWLIISNSNKIFDIFFNAYIHICQINVTLSSVAALDPMSSLIPNIGADIKYINHLLTIKQLWWQIKRFNELPIIYKPLKYEFDLVINDGVCLLVIELINASECTRNRIE